MIAEGAALTREAMLGSGRSSGLALRTARRDRRRARRGAVVRRRPTGRRSSGSTTCCCAVAEPGRRAQPGGRGGVRATGRPPASPRWSRSPRNRGSRRTTTSRRPGRVPAPAGPRRGGRARRVRGAPARRQRGGARVPRHTRDKGVGRRRQGEGWAAGAQSFTSPVPWAILTAHLRGRRLHMSTGRRSARADSVPTEGSVSSESEHSALRTDIRRLSTLLGRTLAQQNGDDMLELVEKVRRLVRAGPGEGRHGDPRPALRPRPGHGGGARPGVRDLLPSREPRRPVPPVPGATRAPRGGRGPDPPARRPARRRGRPRGADDRALPPRAQAGVHRAPDRGPAPVGARQAARDRRTSSRRTSPTRSRRRSCAGSSTCIWQTDEIRPERPTVLDEARVGRLLPRAARPARRARGARRSSTRSWPRVGLSLPDGPVRWCWAAGSAGTATATPTSPPSSPSRRCGSTPSAGVRIQIDLVEELVQELSVSTRLVGVSEDLRRSLARDRRHLPEVYERFVRLNAEEPYRLKCSYVHARLQNTRDRYTRGAPARAGPGLPGLGRVPAPTSTVMDRSLRGALRRPDRRRHAAATSCAPPTRSGCTSRASTSASTPTPPHRARRRCSTGSASWRRPTRELDRDGAHRGALARSWPAGGR